jgi:hypothetical protein
MRMIESIFGAKPLLVDVFTLTSQRDFSRLNSAARQFPQVFLSRQSRHPESASSARCAGSYVKSFSPVKAPTLLYLEMP